jgi:NAD(P)-dependent dehydrogenase (short-subunit alcohol dehydrogenase family)
MARFTTRFDTYATAMEVAEGCDLSGQRVVVTGGNSGLGQETARVLATRGAEVTLAVRDLDAGARATAEIAASRGTREVRVARLDLADRGSIAAFAEAWTGPLHVLVANAGVLGMPETRTAEGWELQFAVNHLGHFALALGLRPALAAAKGARVVAVTSGAHQWSPVVFDDIHFRFRPYDGNLAYGQSKTANILFAVGAQARWADDGITVSAARPPAVITGLQRHIGGGRNIPPHQLRSIEQGAASTVLVATYPELAGRGGLYLDGCKEGEVVHQANADRNGVAAYAVDRTNAERLWEHSLRLLAGAL